MANRDVQTKVTRYISQGGILRCEKTRQQIGKRSITLGPYKEAVSTGRHYAMYLDRKGGGGEVVYFPTALIAAQYYISYVGRDMAWDSLPGAIKYRRR